ncbi:unnamed protein product [Rhizoctonia solani]|uniref:Glycosyl transferase family 3 domain-containing protein n=1 Tax=Rhizoctonia solani TaxID=456999 RepID=A0A8H3E293_9AGAM|nr:unnamed protein product [Rhizoctonia solani]
MKVRDDKVSTSSSGSADSLLRPTPLPNNLFTFLLAAHHHPALTSLAPVRKALPFRTIFNILGPLINPAAPKRMILGELGPVFAEALRGMGVEWALVVCGMGSMDEISIASGTWEYLPATSRLKQQLGPKIAPTVQPLIGGSQFGNSRDTALNLVSSDVGEAEEKETG